MKAATGVCETDEGLMKSATYVLLCDKYLVVSLNSCKLAGD